MLTCQSPGRRTPRLLQARQNDALDSYQALASSWQVGEDADRRDQLSIPNPGGVAEVARLHEVDRAGSTFTRYSPASP